MTTNYSDEYTYRWACLVNDECLGIEDQSRCSYIKTKIDREQTCSLSDDELLQLMSMFAAEQHRRVSLKSGDART
jgi:hypothetical protein